MLSNAYCQVISLVFAKFGALHKKGVLFMDTLAIIKRIEMRITELGMSKADFYKISGISSASYSQWNTGLYKPSEKKLRSAAECLGVSYEYLAFGHSETEKAPTESGERQVSDDDIKFALFGGGGEITDAMYEEVKQFAAFVKNRGRKD